MAAILFTDIVGYTALMGEDEQKAFELLSKNRQIQKPIIEEFNGRFIKELGDGILASFHTVSDAFNAAVKIQEVCNKTKEFLLRIGIHQGEVVFEQDDIFGDAVNIASRIQTLGVPGSILFSKKVNDEIKNKSEFQTVSLGSFDFKNVREPLEVFALAKLNEMEKIVDNLQSLSKKSRSKKSRQGSPAFHVAMIYAMTGRKEFAFPWLEKAYENHEVEMHWLKAERLINPLRNDPRFKELLKKIGFK